MLQDESGFKLNEISEEVPPKVITKRLPQRSDSAQEIISRKPGFIEKWALLLFVGILLLLLAGTWFIRYPDIIEASGKLTADNAPKEIIPLQTGRLIKLFVKNGDEVKAGGMMAWIESAANTQEVIDLSKNVDSASSLLLKGNGKSLTGIFDHPYENLGGLQAPYQLFIAA